jgi:hypothetical protein
LQAERPLGKRFMGMLHMSPILVSFAAALLLEAAVRSLLTIREVQVSSTAMPLMLRVLFEGQRPARADTIVGDVGAQQDGQTIGANDIINGRGGYDTLIGDVFRIGHFPRGQESGRPKVIGGTVELWRGIDNQRLRQHFPRE